MAQAARKLDIDGEPRRSGCALWFTGLPGSGKSTVAGQVHAALSAMGLPVVWLRMDERRKAYFPKPAYTGEERLQAYRMFAEEAAGLAGEGKIVLMDATAHQLAMRGLAREAIDRFAEVHVKCRVAEAMRREAARPGGLVMAGIYAKAIRRKTTGADEPGLGEVVGVDVPFEEDPRAECVIDTEALSPEAARNLILIRFAGWFGGQGDMDV